MASGGASRGLWSPVSRTGAAALCGAGLALAALTFHVWAGVALGNIDVPLRGRHGTWRLLPAFGVAGVALGALGWLWWPAWSPLVARGAAAFYVAGVALGDIDVPCV